MYTPKTSRQQVRNGLAEYFSTIAEWRIEKDIEHPDELRNAKGAEVLREVADYCLTLADDDEVLIRLFALPHCWTEDGLFLEPRHVDESCECVKLVDRCGVDGGDPAGFLVKWVGAVQRDYPKSVKYRVKMGWIDSDEAEIE